MDHLSKAQVEQLRALLIAERRDLTGRTSSAGAGSQDRDVTTDDPGDAQDLAATETLRSTDLELAERQSHRLREVDEALGRIDDGTYGICEETGDAIPFARLLSQPSARYTVEAQERIEHEAKLQRSESRRAY